MTDETVQNVNSTYSLEPYSDKNAWFADWAAQDWSWSGASEKDAWSTVGDLASFLRQPHGSQLSDEDLIDLEILYPCGPFGLFHVLFIPEEWRRKFQLPLTSRELVERKIQTWGAISNCHFRSGAAFNVSGIHVPKELCDALIERTDSSFYFCSFEGKARGLFSHGVREFKSCAFSEKIHLFAEFENKRNSRLFLTKCHFENKVQAGPISGPKFLKFESCNVPKGIEFFERVSADVAIDESEISLLDSAETNFAGSFKLFGTTVTKSFEFFRCDFEREFGIVNSAMDYALVLSRCDFSGRADFSDIFFASDVAVPHSLTGSMFEGIVTFDLTSPPPAHMFESTEFKGEVTFSGYSDGEAKASFREELRTIIDQDISPEAKDKEVKILEDGCRTLRKLAERRGDVHQEYLWHRSELIARFHRASSSLPERLFSKLYGLFADYGLSIVRPFFALVVVVLLSALIYAGAVSGIEFGSSPDAGSIKEGLNFSLNRSFPLGLFEPTDASWLKRLKTNGEGGPNFFSRIYATAQSIVTVILLYLGVMAVRRKFRIA